MNKDEIKIIASFLDTEEALKVRDFMALSRLRARISYEDFYQKQRSSRAAPRPGWRE